MSATPLMKHPPTSRPGITGKVKTFALGKTLALLALLLPPMAWAQAISVVDFVGRTVTLPAPAKRIVALAPHSVENIFSAGAGDRLVGVVSFSNYPPAAGQIVEVGNYNAYSVETIASLQPDLIVMWASGNGMQTLDKLEPLGIPVFVSEPRRLEDIPRVIRSLGQLAGSRSVSETEARRIEQAFGELRSRYAALSPVKVLYEIWNQPLQTINGDHLISQVIQLCGGRNIYADVAILAPRINIESVLAGAPDAIVASGMSRARPEWLDDWREYPSLPAVANNALFFVDPDHLQRPTARVLLGARTLCEQLDSVRH
jgi:iron complex transport system substrate-binding protein